MSASQPPFLAVTAAMASPTVRIFWASSSEILISKDFFDLHHDFDGVERVGTEMPR
jgi:hypothetical protein